MSITFTFLTALGAFLSTTVQAEALITKETQASDQTKAIKSSSPTTPNTCEQWSEVWTNWDRMPFWPSIFNLANIRGNLNENNLYDTYQELPQKIDNQIVQCDERSKFARTDNGTCNNLSQPTMGAKGIAFGRNVPLNKVVKNHEENLLSPNPVTISQELLRRDNFKPVRFLNFLVTSWLQFMNHDWFFHGKNEAKKPYRVKVQNRRERYRSYSQALHLLSKSHQNPNNKDHEAVYDVLKIPRTKVDPTLQKERNPQISEGKVYRNAVTHWWDGSQIYGSDSQTLKTIRAYKDGKMIVDENGLLPLGEDQMEKVGFKDNWWVGLSMLHHLFVLEHNAIAEMLKKSYPSWSDQKLYDTARLINAALMAKIHTVEWTPAILPNPTLKIGMETNWYGALNPQTLSSLARGVMNGENPVALCQEDSTEGMKRFSALMGGALFQWVSQFEEKADYNLGDSGLHPILIGMVGGETNLHNVPYTLTEEFVAVYRMHPLLPEELEVVDTETTKKQVVPLNETRHEKSMKLIQRHGLKNLFYSFGRAHPGALALKNYPRFMTKNFDVPENPKGTQRNIDMGALDVLRDRERGVLRYNNFRRSIGLNPIRKFEDLFVDEKRPESFHNLESAENQELLKKLKSIYQNDVEQLDLLVGTLAEHIRPKQFGFGETVFQIFILMATRRLQADRFFTEDYTPEIYTQEGLDWINANNMKKVILRHFPTLSPALEGVENAFNPWKEIH